MKRLFKLFTESGLYMFAIVLLSSLLGLTGVEAVMATAPAAATATGQPEAPSYQDLDGGGAIGEGFQTLDEALEISPNLVTKKVHEEVIKIAPYDYVARSLLAKNFKQKKATKDHRVVVYSAASKPIKLTLETAVTSATTSTVTLDFGSQNDLVAVTQTLTFPGIDGYKSDGETKSGHALVCYVVGKESNGKINVIARNGVKVGAVITVPDLVKGTLALRGLRVGTESQIRTEPINILPTDKNYYIQKNIIEFGVTGWFNDATKEVRWEDRDRMEMAIAEKTRTSMPDFWLGAGNVKPDERYSTEYNGKKPELAYFNEGIWYQAGREFDFQGADITADLLIDFGKYVFTGNRSSNVKYLVMGSDMSAAFQKAIFSNPTFLGETYRDKELNINFTAINFFGGKKILFADDPSLDDIGMSDCGFVIDHKYAFEYHYGMKSVQIDGIKLATSDTKGQSLIEENCFILANNDSHCRVKL